MKIKKIQLSGFKSFVDSTTIEFGADMTGIVGPNGCGKSNIVDAVRWVTGQSARNIRAANIDDVIFNGTDTRKPVGQASVELLFDNEDGAVADKYASYNEIALKRAADRTQGSKYSINTTRCRQRDISDLLSGTGLGAHSYALIEQGMITRIIEADPKEMRLYLEEAAGISKYRERRRETEIRMRHTRDNLDRLMDIRDEVNKQLNKLKRQARSAKQFKELRLERDKATAFIAYLEMQHHQSAVAECESKLSDLRIEMEKEQANLRKYEADIEAKHSLEGQHGNDLNSVREKYYQLNATIGGVEQDISNRSKNAEQIQKEVFEVSKLLEKCKNNIQAQTQNRETITHNLKRCEENYQTASTAFIDIEQRLKDEEITLDKMHREWEQHHGSNVELSESLEVLRIKIEYCERELVEIGNQEREIAEQKSSLDFKDLESQVTESHSHRQSCREKIEENDQQTQLRRSEVEKMRENLKASEKSSEILQSQLQEMREEMASLKALQSAEGGDGFFRWLEDKNLSKQPRLATKINPDKRWEGAVETVLGNLLSAVEVNALDEHTKDAANLPAGMFVIYEPMQDVAGKEGTLASKVSADYGMNVLLNHILLADDLEIALAMRKNLAAHESAVTPDGFWVGRNWIRAHRHTDKKESILTRQHMIDDLSHKITDHEERFQAPQEEIGRLREQISDNENRSAQAQKQNEELLAQLSEAELKWRRNEVRLNHAKDVNADLEERKNQVSEWRQSIEQQHVEHIKKRESIESSMPEQSGSKNERSEAQRKVANIREELGTDKDKLHQLEIEKNSLSGQLKGISDNLSHLSQQQEDLQQRQTSLGETEKGFQDPIKEKQSELGAMAQEREQVKKGVQDKTTQLDNIKLEIEQIQAACRNIRETTSKMLERREKVRIDLQRDQMLRDDLKAKINKLDMSSDAIAQELPKDSDVKTLKANLEDIEKRIDRLGPINLIADQEFNELTERKDYIDSQHKDLTTALETLETAIVRIEQESKEKFKTTFENINIQLKTTFERLFGGGEAHLELLENSWLKGGVAVMARPPGKKLSSIKLLSGGEKALSALAVIFSIFELNPAPVCMLDEVDAPLDESNVIRFCELIREMSKRVQFIIVTHNRITMENMNCLLGVTMGEPGVSNIVSVNVDEAVKIVNA